MSEALSRWFNTTFLGRCWQRYQDYVQYCLTSGNIPATQPWLIYPSRMLMGLWQWLQVGRVRVIGAKHLRTPGRVIFCCNHSSLLDAIVMHPLMKRNVRFMGAYEAMQGYGGLKAILMCAIGCFPVDRKNGRTVLGPATDLLTNGEPLFICPEGRVDNTGTLGEFKPGAALIARAAYRKLQGKEKVGIVPIHICYHKRNVKTGDTWNFFKMGFTWRGGATVHVCEPVWINDNPQLGACEFMELVRSKIAQFSCTCSVSV